MKHLLLAAALLLAAHAPRAQVAPSATEAQAYTGLHAAAWRGDVAAIEQAAARGKAPLDARDGHGRTPLHVATFARQRGAVGALLAAGALHAVLDDDRYDAVTIAAVADDEATLRILLQAGASAGLTTSRYDGTALIAAAHLGHDGVVRQLIAAGAPLDHVNNLHWTAMIEAVVLGDGGPRHQATLQALLDAGADRRLTDREGRTPLQLARSRGYAAMEKMLAPAAAGTWTLAGPKALIAHLRGSAPQRIGTVNFEPAADGKGPVRFTVTMDSARYTDHFLSMKEFKCLGGGGGEISCHVPYPYPQPGTVTASDFSWLEHALLFLYKTPTDFGAKLWNGLYFRLQATGQGLVGTPQAIDLNLISAPPDRPGVPPYRPALRDDIPSGARALEKITIE